MRSTKWPIKIKSFTNFGGRKHSRYLLNSILRSTKIKWNIYRWVWPFFRSRDLCPSNNFIVSPGRHCHMELHSLHPMAHVTVHRRRRAPAKTLNLINENPLSAFNCLTLCSSREGRGGAVVVAATAPSFQSTSLSIFHDANKHPNEIHILVDSIRGKKARKK